MRGRTWDAYCQDCGHKLAEGEGLVRRGGRCPKCGSKNIRVRVWSECGNNPETDVVASGTVFQTPATGREQ
jgi:predicted RNA-binding Zn-ribbon protein involved in translation (DUF1610 family)